ncbi:MAG: C40 family peptidase [Pelosinus sp.]|nr:C40 family peptidase [Pelosinus sp.]
MHVRLTSNALGLILLLLILIITYGLYVSNKSHQPQDNVVALSKEYLGVPYRYGGSTPAGFDCSGYIMFLFHQCGKDLPRTADKQATVGIPVSINNLQPGDLLFFATTDQADITHTGLYLGSHMFIHASFTAQKVIISNLDEPYWQKAFRTARQIRQ